MITSRDGRIARTVLDVRKNEPAFPASPLHAFDGVILTPHTAGLTQEAQENVVNPAAEDVGRLLNCFAFNL
jgi:D-3-phosphoglycerate dehydrogenase